MRIQNIEMVVALKVCEIIRVDTKKVYFLLFWTLCIHICTICMCYTHAYSVYCGSGGCLLKWSGMFDPRLSSLQDKYNEF